MDAIDSCSSSPHPTRRIYSEEVSTKALKNVLLVSNKDDDRRKLKQDVFIEGKFEDICSLVAEKSGPDLHDQLSVLFKTIDEMPQNEETLENDENYSVMKDGEPYMRFCPQIFMY